MEGLKEFTAGVLSVVLGTVAVAVLTVAAFLGSLVAKKDVSLFKWP